MLKNGFRYVVHRRVDVPGQAWLSFVVHAGSGRDQTPETAHLVEHLVAFSGSGTAVGSAFDQIIRRGGTPASEFAASTIRERTVYRMRIDLAAPGALDDALLLFRAHAADRSFADADVARERAAILAEKRQNETLEGRLTAARNRVLFPGQPQLAAPVGVLAAAVDGLDAAAANAFYRRWYRPDLETLVIVGDVDPAAVASRIETLFASIPLANETVEPLPVLPPASGIEWHISRDAALAGPRLDLWFERPSGGEDEAMARLISALLHARLQQLAERYQPVVRDIVVGSEQYSSGRGYLSAIHISAAPDRRRSAAGIARLVGAIRQAAAEGFTVEEISAAAAAVRAETPPEWRGRGEVLAANYQDAFERGGVPGAIDPAADPLAGLGSMRPEAIADAAKRMLGSTSVPMLLMLPQSSEAPLTVDAAKSLFTVPLARPGRIEATALSAPAAGRWRRLAPIDLRPIVELAPRTAMVAKGRDFSVLIEPDPAAARIELLFLRNGGTAAFEGEDHMAAQAAPRAILHAGLAGRDGFALGRWLKARDITWTPFVEAARSGVRASAPPGELPALLDLLEAQLAPGSIGMTAWCDWIEREGDALAERVKDRYAAFSTMIEAGTGNPTRLQMTPGALEALDVARVGRVAAMLFDRGRGGAVVLRGAVDRDAALAMLSRFAASIPEGAAAPVLAIGEPPQAANKDVTRIMGHGPAYVQLRFLTHADKPTSPTSGRGAAYALGEILQQRLFDRLRGAEQGVYSVNANLDASVGSITVEFSCAPIDIDRLTAAAAEEIARLADEPLTASESDIIARLAAAPQPPTIDELASALLARTYRAASPHSVSPDAVRALLLPFKGTRPVRFVLLPEHASPQGDIP